MDNDDAAPAAAPGAQVLQIIVDTPTGVCVRTVPAALPLPEGVDQGTGAELAAHQAAAMWGLPDFVFRSAIRKVSSGQREIGDRILLAGSRGASVQIKSREGDYKDEAGERSWLRSRGSKAARQAKGTVRNLRTTPAELENGRGRTITVRGEDYEWIAVVVLDHDRVPADTVIDCAVSGMPGIALVRRDWDFLFNQLRSTTAVVDYLFRTAELPPVPLGDEPARYYELAAHDLEAEPGTLTDAVNELGGQRVSLPLLPQAPVGSSADQAHLVTRVILEDIATSGMHDGMTEANRLTLMSELDALLPASERANWGRLLLEMLDAVRKTPLDQCAWRWRRVINGSGSRQLILGTATRYDPSVKATFMSYVMLRHHELGQHTGLTDETLTLAVLLTPLKDQARRWDTSVMRTLGDNQLSPEDVDRCRRFLAV
ncbi:hypothetical protein ACIQZN_25310 [Streptomyces sp. NPDC097595]|uniref:hypothetical protein n=1 Tax=Streptomyces sp. NPDC097595 TaxID=3366090 RepID=UPI0037F3B9CC